MEIQRGGKAWSQPSRRTLLVICSLSKLLWWTRHLESVAICSYSPKDQIIGNGWISMRRAGWRRSGWKPPPDSVIHPRREMDRRRHHEVFYEQLTTCDIRALWRQSKNVSFKNRSQLLVADYISLSCELTEELLQPDALERVLLWSIKCLVFLESQKWDGR